MKGYELLKELSKHSDENEISSVLDTTVFSPQKLAKENMAFRKVLITDTYSQLVVMSLKPNENIGKEVHDDGMQYTRVEEGSGQAIINGETIDFKKGDAIIIHAGMEHDIVNTSNKDMKLLVLYAPPRHKPNLVQQNKEDQVEDYE